MKQYASCFFALTLCFLLVFAGCGREEQSSTEKPDPSSTSRQAPAVLDKADREEEPKKGALEIDLRKSATYKALLSGDSFVSKIYDLGNKGELRIKFIWDRSKHMCVGTDAFLDDEIIAKAVFKGYKEAGRAQLQEIHYARGSNGETIIYRALSTYGIGGEKVSEQAIEGAKRYEIFDVWKTER